MLQCHTASEEIIEAKITWYVYFVLFSYPIYNSSNSEISVKISFFIIYNASQNDYVGNAISQIARRSRC